MVVPRFESISEKNARLRNARKAKEDSFQVYFEEKLKAALAALPYGSKVQKSDLAKQIQLDAREIICRAADRGDFTTVEKLVRMDESLVHSQINRTNETPLHIACRKGYTDMVKFLVEYGKASINAVDYHGNQPLHTAAFHGKASIVRYLLRVGGASINDLGYKFQSPIYMAASRHELQTVRVLLEFGADPRYKDPITGKYTLPRLTSKMVASLAEEEDEDDNASTFNDLSGGDIAKFSGDIYIGDTMENLSQDSKLGGSIDSSLTGDESDEAFQQQNNNNENSQNKSTDILKTAISGKTQDVFGEMEVDYTSDEDNNKSRLETTKLSSSTLDARGIYEPSLRPPPLQIQKKLNSKLDIHKNNFSSPINFNNLDSQQKFDFSKRRGSGTLDKSFPQSRPHTPKSSPKSALLAANASASDGIPKNYAFLLHSPSALAKSVRSPRYAHLNKHTTTAAVFILSGKEKKTIDETEELKLTQAQNTINEQLLKLAALTTTQKINYLSPKLDKKKKELLKNMKIRKYTNRGPIKQNYNKKIKKNMVFYEGTEDFTDSDPVEYLYPNDSNLHGVNLDVLITLLLQEAWEINVDKYGELPWRVV